MAKDGNGTATIGVARRQRPVSEPGDRCLWCHTLPLAIGPGQLIRFRAGCCRSPPKLTDPRRNVLKLWQGHASLVSEAVWKAGATIFLRRVRVLFWRKQTEGDRMTQTRILPLARGRCIVSGMALPAVVAEAVTPGSGVAAPAVPAKTVAGIDALRGLALNKQDPFAKEGSARAAPAILRPGLGMSMRGLNPSAYTCLLQSRFAKKGAYEGPLNGLMTTPAIPAIHTVCRERGVESRRAKGPLHPDTARVLSELLN